MSNQLIDTHALDAKMLQRLISTQAEWFDCFGRNEKFNVPLIKRSAVVAGTCIGISKYIQDIEFDLCIIDEASKATATEVLVPMSRTRRWILVGDTKQLPPFQDEVSRNAEFLEKYDLTEDDIKETLFDRLLRTLPNSSCKMLKIQHRMVAPIKDTENRPQFQQALAFVATGADGIIAAKLDRLARNTRDVLTLVDDVLQPQKKALILLDLQVDTTTPQGYMILTVMSAVAKLERDLINERTQGGRRAKAANGGYAYGSPAFGQVAIEGDLMPKSDELEVVELIRRHHKSGKSFQAIASWLNEKGHKTKRGCDWQAMSVKRVVDRLYPKAA